MGEKHMQGERDTSVSVSRRTFVGAAGATAGVGLAGCVYGGSGSEDSVVWGFDPNPASEIPDEIRDLYYEAGLDEDIEIEFRGGEEDTGERRNSYIDLFEAGETQPELFLIDNGWATEFIQRGYLENLTEVLDDDELAYIDDEYFDGFTDTVRDPETGDLYGIPYYPDFPTMQYRKDYAREAGYDDDDFEEWATEPMTWLEWAEIVEDVVEASDADYGFTTQFAIYEGTACCTFNEVLSSWGGAYFGGRDNLFGPVGDRPITVDEPEFIDAIRMMRTFVADEHGDDTLEEYPTGIANPGITSHREGDAEEDILDGAAAFQRNWPFTLHSGPEEHGVDNWGAMPIPYAVSEEDAAQSGTGGTTAALGGWHVVLNPNAENRDEAIEVLRTTMEDSVSLGLFEEWGWLPPKPALFESAEAEAIEPVGEYLETLRVAGENTMARPSTRVWSSQSSNIAEEVNRAVAGEKDPEEAAADLYGYLDDLEQS